MEIARRRSGDVTILDLDGKITIGEGDVQLRRAVQEEHESGHNDLLLNMAAVKYMDSSGVGELVNCYSSTAKSGGHLKLLSLTSRIEETLALTSLTSIFEVFSDEQEALASFG